ncbi:peptidylprolyl isomerase [Lutibacter citreus]|uniref:peptidylprolyl isomerase n=1 Tax=Lutibacter citreus TaxID=2138210 RepID=UPI000DBE41A6|nr:peptidylprolyl isomerase [Lutibacter citreus]
MKLKYSFILLLFLSFSSFSQKKQKELFSINDSPVYSNDFLNNFKKNRHQAVDSLDDIGSYLKLFINYKLKIKEAKDIKLDTFSKYIEELKDYKERLSAPYLRDKEVTDKLVKEAYGRMQNEVSASHILVFLKPQSSPKDTLLAFNKIIKARDLIIGGKAFNEVAKEFSEDPSAKQNGGNLGYFTVFQMVYPFENAAYSTKVNDVSKPFRTKFGYHILQVNDVRKAKGQVEVAHIMVNNKNENAKIKIDSIYNLIINKNESFEELAKKTSDDRASAINGGKLDKFSFGQMLEDFANVAFSLKNENEYSKPFQTQYGWHIVKLLKKYPIDSFVKERASLTKKVEKDNRSELIGKSVVNKLINEYKIVINDNALKQFNSNEWKSNTKNYTKILLTVESKDYYQKDFIGYLKSNKYNGLIEAFNQFKEGCIINYYKDNLEFTNSEFASTFKDFKEGLLLFDLLEKRVWNKSKDSVGISNYFIKFKEQKYKDKELNNIKGTVINDYQNYLERLWVEELHKRYKVKINKSEKRKILKFNNSKI